MLWQRGKAYSQDLRERILASADDGLRVGQIADLYRVSVAYVSKVLARRRQTGVTTALAQRGHLRPKLIDLYDTIGAHVASCPDATIAELQIWLSKTHQVTASGGLVWKTLARLGLTYKKNRSMLRNKGGRTSPASARNGVQTSRP